MSDVVLTTWTQAHCIEARIELHRLALAAAEVHDFEQAWVLCSMTSYGIHNRWTVAYGLSMNRFTEQDIAAFFSRVDAAAIRNHPIEVED